MSRTDSPQLWCLTHDRPRYALDDDRCWVRQQDHVLPCRWQSMTSAQVEAWREGINRLGSIDIDSDPVAVVRRGVESGTIKGEVIWRCGEGSGHEDGWFCDRAVPKDQLGPNCGYRLLIPVSDGGSET